MQHAVYNESRKSLIAKQTRYCTGIWPRMKGLLGLKTLPADEACWLVPCNHIHTFGMRFPIDVYFLDRDNRVIGIQQNIKPNRFSRFIPGTKSVIEVATGITRDCGVGDILLLGDQR